MRVADKTIPKPVRERLGIGPGSEVGFAVEAEDVAIVFTEVSISSMHFAELDLMISSIGLAREDLSRKTGKAHRLCRRRRGARDRTRPDVLSGAHALVPGHRPLIRDPRRRADFPTVQFIAPDTHP